MQAPLVPLNDKTPSALSPSDYGESVSPTATNNAIEIDPLVLQTAKKLADVINDFKRELDKRDSIWATATGGLELALKTDQSQTYKLSIVQDADGDTYPVTVQATLNKKNAMNRYGESPMPLITTTSSTINKPTRRDSDSEIERDIISRKKRKLNNGENIPSKKLRPDDEDEDEDSIPLVSKHDVEVLLANLREDVQDDTSECVNHVQKLLRRFTQEWRQKNNWDNEHMPARPTTARDSVVGIVATPGTFPSPGVDKDDQNTSLGDVMRRDTKLLSSQIRWVEDCRRIAAERHEQREENWRTSSAGFHDRTRQDRENFQHRVLHESTIQGKMLQQILNEVKAIGLYAQSMKWETPSHLAPSRAYPPPPTASALSAQAPARSSS